MNDTVSTAVKRVRFYRLPDGTKVLDVMWVDPAEPHRLLVDSDIMPVAVLDYIKVTRTV